MKKVIITCDCCGDEIQEDQVFGLEHYVHVSPEFDRMGAHSQIVNGRMYLTSRRTHKKDFCLPCYNFIFDVLFQEINAIKDKSVKA